MSVPSEGVCQFNPRLWRYTNTIKKTQNKQQQQKIRNIAKSGITEVQFGLINIEWSAFKPPPYIRKCSINLKKPRLINLINYSTTQNKSSLIVSLAADKTFNKVYWKSLFATLHKFGFGHSLSSWIRLQMALPMSVWKQKTDIVRASALKEAPNNHTSLIWWQIEKSNMNGNKRQKFKVNSEAHQCTIRCLSEVKQYTAVESKS